MKLNFNNFYAKARTFFMLSVLAFGLTRSETTLAQCVAASGTSGIYPLSSNVSCVTNGPAFSQTYTFNVPTTVVYSGATLTVTSVTIDSITGLPAGLSWSANSNPANFAAGTAGCYIISGTTNAPCGEYLFNVWVRAYTTAIPSGLELTTTTAGYPNQYLQVKASGNSCPTLNTSQTAAFVSNPNCTPTGSTPTVVTYPASNITSSSAILNGTINANNTTTTAAFQWGVNTSYTGGTVTATPNTVTGTTTTAISYNLSGLAANTTYHYRSVGNGNDYGADMTFTTLSGTGGQCVAASGTTGIYPLSQNVACANQGVSYSQTYTLNVPTTVVYSGATLTVTSVTIDSITGLPAGLSWSANSNPANFAAGTAGCYIISGTTNAPCGEYLFNVWVRAYTTAIPSGLELTTTTAGYPNQYLQVIASGNSCPTLNTSQTAAFVANVNCTSSGSTPTVLTYSASNITSSSATLNGTINANNTSTNATFQWGINTSYTGGTVSATPGLVTGSTTTSISYALSGLAANTTYHYRAVGNGNVYGADMTFTTLSGAGGPCVAASGTTGIYPLSQNVACANQGVSYSQNYTFNVPTTVVYSGATLTVTSVTIDSITGLPAGLSWSANSNPANFAAGTAGCYIISGTTNAPCGEYLFNVWVRAYTTAIPSGTELTTTTAGYPNQYLQVIASGNSCPTLNTSQTAAFVANANCTGSGSNPIVLTEAATNVTSSSATINGLVTANNVTTNTTFQWGTTTSYTGGTVTASPSQVTGNTATIILYNLSGLAASTTYHYRAVGNGNIYGQDLTFTTLANGGCVPQSGVTSGVYPASANVPCASQGVSFSQTYTIYVPTTYNANGTTLIINSVTIDSITGLPAGLTWSANSSPASYAGGSTGCYIISGVTNAPCGQYLLTIIGTAYTNLGTPITVNATVIGYPNQYIRVNTSGSSCLAVDTTQTVAFVANPSCTGTVTTAPTVSFTNITEVSCYGQGTGAVTAVGAGGNGGYTYLWAGGATTATITNLRAGTYTVTVTSGGQTVTGNVTITQSGIAVGASATSTVTGCSSNTGTATVTASGGVPGYTYQWSNSQTSNQITGLGAGTYTVVVSDSHGCTASAAASVNTSASFTINLSSTPVNCFGGNNGTANVTVNGASGTLTYAWSTSATSQSISNLTAGNYSVVVTQASSGCSKSGNTTVSQPSSALTASAQATTTSCSSHTGTIYVTPNGGTPGYTYQWSNSTTANPVTGLGASSITGTVTDSRGCTTTISGTVNQPPSFGVSANATNINCVGLSTGSVVATVTVNGSYSYFWSNGGSNATILNVTAGTYSVTVTDGFGCTETASATITQPNSGVNATTSSTQTSCAGNTGSATVNASGGQNPYNYLWSNTGTGSTISNLAAGNYSVTVTDNSGCSVLAVASVSSAATFTLTLNPTSIACYGSSTGAVSAAISGGTPPFTYSWSNGATSSGISGLPAGTFNVTVTDGSGCSKAASTTVSQPANGLIANATATNSTCNSSSGTATVSVVGGTGSPVYVWSNHATSSSITNLGVGVYSVTVTEGNCTATSSAVVNNINGPGISLTQTDPTCSYSTNGTATAVASLGTSPYSYTWNNSVTGPNLTNLGAGTYTVVVIDNTGCRATGAVTLVAPAPITFNAQVGNENCAGDVTGTVTLNPGGGTGPYQYNWYNGTDLPDVASLGVGNYAVTVTDSRNCTAVSTFNVSAPQALAVTANSINTNNGTNGSASATVSGGTLPYYYNWSGGQTSSSISGLTPNTYSVTVVDANGCSGTAGGTVILSGIEDISNVISSATIIPNPANDLVNVIVQLESTQTVQLKVVDLTGKYIYTGEPITAQGRLTQQINLSEYAAGIYLVEISAGQQVIRKRMVVTK